MSIVYIAAEAEQSFWHQRLKANAIMRTLDVDDIYLQRVSLRRRHCLMTVPESFNLSSNGRVRSCRCKVDINGPRPDVIYTSRQRCSSPITITASCLWYTSLASVYRSMSYTQDLDFIETDLTHARSLFMQTVAVAVQ